MNIRPIGPRLVVKRAETKAETAGGLVIPDNAKEKPVEGEVVAIGETSKVKIGERVLFGKYAGTEVVLDGEERLILTDEDVLCVLED